MNPHVIEVAGETVELLAAKAVHWPARRTLFIADPHWGKAAAFRAGGVGIGVDPLEADLERLSTLLRQTDANRLVILGDLFHARAGKSKTVLETVTAWRKTVADVGVTLIRGNHDLASGDPPAEWGFNCNTEPVPEPPFALKHHPGETPGFYTLAGHLHPAATLRGHGRALIRLPCFHIGSACGILPAFGGFTGLATIAPVEGDRVFVIADGEVVPVHT